MQRAHVVEKVGVTPSRFGNSLPAGQDRQALLLKAADQLDLGEHHRGGGGSGAPVETPAGNATRGIADDKAYFAAAPLLHRLEEKDFTEAGRPVPAKFLQYSKQYDFYELHLPIVLKPGGGFAFNKINASVEFNVGAADPYSRPKAYEILPKSAFRDLLKADMHLEVALDEDFQFSAKAVPDLPDGSPLKAKAQAGVNAAGGGSMTMGPFSYRLQRATIQHNAPFAEEVWWTIDDAKILAGDEPLLFVIVQVPKSTRELKLTCVLEVFRRFSWFSADFQQAIKRLADEGIKQFFKAGAPYRDFKEWDLSAKL